MNETVRANRILFVLVCCMFAHLTMVKGHRKTCSSFCRLAFLFAFFEGKVVGDVLDRLEGGSRDSYRDMFIAGSWGVFFILFRA